MFGNPVPPRPSRNQPWLLLGIGVLIAAVLTLLAGGIMHLAERFEQAGQDDVFGFAPAYSTYASAVDLPSHSGSAPAARRQGDSACG